MSSTAAPSPISVYGATRRLVEHAVELGGKGIDCALAMVVDTSGACYRGRGAMALLDTDGVREGALTADLQQASLLTAARDVLANGRAIELPLVAAAASRTLLEASGRAALASARTFVLRLPAAGSPLREALATAAEASAWLRLRLDTGADDAGRTGLGRGEARIGSRMFAFDARGDALAVSMPFTRHVGLALAPPPRLLLTGAAPETATLARLARLLGWYVDLVEHRVESLPEAITRNVDRVHAIVPEGLPRLLSERHFDATVACSHDFTIDLQHLRHLAGAGIGYVGLLGSPDLRDAMLSELGDIVATQLEPRLYAPAGLRLGGEGPEATALAIIAQLQHYLAYDALA
ncbi:XdhC family protein [Dokdonella sp. MW10]|uniref:XdhC family protein n=1 Tax=Dokdonella sp. MW10 TaxID=2992926 RepID=UPI003F7DBED0